MKTYSVFHLAHINWNKVFHLGYRNISLHLLTWSGTPEVNIAIAGNENNSFFSWISFGKSTRFDRFMNVIYDDEIHLKVLGKGLQGSFAR